MQQKQQRHKYPFKQKHQQTKASKFETHQISARLNDLIFVCDALSCAQARNQKRGSSWISLFYCAPFYDKRWRYSVYRFLSSSMLLSKIFFSPSLNITAQRTWNDNALPVLLSNCSSCCMVVGYCWSICCSPSVREAVTNASFSLLTSLLFFITSCRCSVLISCIGSRRCMRRAVRRCGGSCCSCSSKGRSFCMPCCWSSSSFAG